MAGTVHSIPGPTQQVGSRDLPTAPPTAAEDMSVVQKCEQLEACLSEMHAVVEQIESPPDTNEVSAATPSTPGAHGSLDRLQSSGQRLLGRLQVLKNSIGQI